MGNEKHRLKIYKNYYDLIDDGTKTIEIRSDNFPYNRIDVGDELIFNGKLIKTVKKIRRYKTLTFLKKCYVEAGFNSYEEAKEIYNRFYPSFNQLIVFYLNGKQYKLKITIEDEPIENEFGVKL